MLNYLDRIYGLPLRYLACIALRKARRPLSVAEIVEAIQAEGWDLGDQPNKLVADAIRWEVRKRRILKVARGRYRYGRMPRSTEWWMQNQVASIRSARFAQTLAENTEDAPAEFDTVPRIVNDIEIERVEAAAGAICAEILATLPTWFATPEANAAYVEAADTHTTFVAFGSVGTSARPVGLTTVTRFGEYSAEVHLMAVVPELHRSGIGRRTLDAAEAWLRAQGVEYLQVKNCRECLALSAMGFRPLESGRMVKRL
jgi:GNAT superfamily N-acetyltransferase